MRKDLEKNCKLMLSYLKSLQQEPVVLTVKNMKVKFERVGVKIAPCNASKNTVLSQLEKDGKIVWNRKGEFKFNPIIVLL